MVYRLRFGRLKIMGRLGAVVRVEGDGRKGEAENKSGEQSA